MAPAPYQTPPTAPAPYQTPPTAPAPYQTPPTAPAPYQAPAIGGSCPSCGQPVVPGAAFCDSCGANLPAPGGYPPIAPPVTPPVMPPVMSGMRMLLVVANSGVQMPLAGKQEFYLGREDPIGQFFPDADLTPHGGDVGGVSRRHAKIVVYGNQVMFEDLNSTNGSFVNKVKVQPGQPVPLTNGAEVRLGKVVLLFQTS
ncbi:MAG: FHA domain-containing protein [Anaerolineae bacterium]